MVNADNDNFIEVADALGLLETLEQALTDAGRPEAAVRRGGGRRRQMQRARLVVLKPEATGARC